MKFQDHQPPPAGFQLAPMIDVVFLLLIFFIVTMQMSDSETELDVKVPTAEEGVSNPRQYLEKVINVRSDGSLVIDREQLTHKQLLQRMTSLVRVNKNQPIRIRGDAKTEYQDVVKVIDTCRKAGIWNISFATQAPKQDQ